MNKQDEERVREIAREEAQKWYANTVAGPMLDGLWRLSMDFFGPGKVQGHESESTPDNQS